MPESRIIKGIKNRGVHIVGASHGNLLGIASAGSRHKLMGYQNISLIRVRSHFFQRCPDRIRIGDNFLIREVFSYLSRLHKRQKIQIHRARRILQHEGIHMAVIHRSDCLLYTSRCV